MGTVTFYIFMFEDVGTKRSSLHVTLEIVTKSMLTVMHRLCTFLHFGNYVSHRR